MKRVIYYFSSTGNSLQVAKELAHETGAELIPVATGKTVQADWVGIVFPVYIWGLPVIVAKFAEQLKIPKSSYVFGVATCGGIVGEALNQLAEIFKLRGIKLAAGFVLRMPGNYTPLYGGPSPEAMEKYFSKVAAKMPEIINTIQENVETKIPHSGWLVRKLLYEGMYKKGVSELKNEDKKYWAMDSCDGCSICAKVCPVNNIKMVKEKPTWLHKCEHCLACLQWCPKEAIQYTKTTIKKKRYHHPEVKLSDLIYK